MLAQRSQLHHDHSLARPGAAFLTMEQGADNWPTGKVTKAVIASPPLLVAPVRGRRWQQVTQEDSLLDVGDKNIRIMWMWEIRINSQTVLREKQKNNLSFGSLDEVLLLLQMLMRGLKWQELLNLGDC